MGFAHQMAKKLTAHPALKAFLKDIYMFTGSVLSNKKTDLPGLVQISSDGADHNFGYYDKSPWSRDQKYMIYLQPAQAAKSFVSTDETPILLYDCAAKTEKIIAKTHVWNSQQGCMLQWLGPDFSTRILYNDFRNGNYCAVILDLESGIEREICRPVYSVAADGKKAISLDFSRLNTFRPGYGYANLPDETREERCPDTPCLWMVDLEQNTEVPLSFTYRQLAALAPQDSMKQGYHKINHAMINPSATRMMFIHRWITNGVKHHRLITCNLDGSDLYVLLDDGMVSHNNWQDDRTIVSFCFTQENGDAYHLLHDKTQRREAICRELTVDGHPSFSPDGRYLITDTYPDFKRKQTLYLVRVSDWSVRRLGSIYANIRFKNDTRCDLHPRWNSTSDAVCFDGANGKRRQVFTLKVDRF